jgi:predicted enzyme related to lactoylglutathione lyase
MRRLTWTIIGLIAAAALVGCGAAQEQPRIMERASHGDLRLYRVILPSSDIERDVAYYAKVFQVPGRRVSPGRHYFDAGEVILAIVDPKVDESDGEARSNADHVYFAVADLEAVHARVRTAGGQAVDDKIETRPWGERSFYAKDAFGNPICFVDEKTVFTGR